MHLELIVSKCAHDCPMDQILEMDGSVSKIFGTKL